MVKAVVEIPQNSRFKFEIKDTNLVLDRMLNQEIPFTYGYIPDTMCDDGDPLDVFLITDGFIPPLAQVNVSIIGAFKCIDNGKQDDKLIGRIIGDTESGVITELKFNKIKSYLRTYKENFEIIEEVGITEAMKILEESEVR
jgi:inorganic pyrophosphatase